MVDSKTETSTIEKTFHNFTQERKDIAIVLINQHVCCPSSMTLLSRCWLFIILTRWDNARLPNESGQVSIPLRTRFLLCWRFRVKTTHTIRRRIVYLNGCGECLGSKPTSGVLGLHGCIRNDCQVLRVNATYGQYEGKPRTELSIDGKGYPTRLESCTNMWMFIIMFGHEHTHSTDF